jgi:hypothetical protein
MTETFSSASTLQELTAHIVSAIARAPIDPNPFPHIIVERLLPNDLFAEVLGSLPDRTKFEKVLYPGTGFSRGRGHAPQHDYGYAYRDLSATAGAVKVLHGALAAPEFTEALFNKFAAPLPDGSTPIPLSKHRFFAYGARDYTTVFDIQIDLPGYAIPPHPDVEQKIITFQLYLTEDTSMAEFGTLLCEPIDERVTKGRSFFARSVGRILDSSLNPESRLFQKLERSELGAWSGMGRYKANWYPWSWFRVAKTAKALPNHFLAFAPNSRSFHAVDLDVPRDARSPERPVVRGFVRSGRDAKNWMSKAII